MTGGVGMGKSKAAQLLRSRGVPVVDTDEVARELVEPGQPALAEIERLFGPQFIGSDGGLRRPALAKLVFSDAAARKQLEDVLHPRIRQVWRAQLAVWKTQSQSIVVVVIPLLFETNAQIELDATVCVACSQPTQQRRLLVRGWSKEQIQQRIQAQWPLEQKIARADFVVWTEAGLDVHTAQLDRILSQVMHSANPPVGAQD